MNLDVLSRSSEITDAIYVASGRQCLGACSDFKPEPPDTNPKPYFSQGLCKESEKRLHCEVRTEGRRKKGSRRIFGFMYASLTTERHDDRAHAGHAPASLDLSVIIVNYNVREFLEQALRSVERAARGLRVEVFVVDNGSVDGSAEMIRTYFPDVHLIINDENVGFARANNQAIRKARGRFLLILNPDTIVQEDTFRMLLAFMDRHPEAGAVGCTILNPDGSFALESRRAFPTPLVAFYRIIGLSHLFPRSRRFGRYNLTYLPHGEIAEVDALSGSCMLVRHAALHYAREEVEALQRSEIDPNSLRHTRAPGYSGNGAGLLDENFFMYGEDLDWCYRIQQAGWKVYYTPETRIIHYKGESTKKGELRYVRLFYGAMSRFADKHFQGHYSRLFAALLHAGILLRASATVIANVFRRLRAPLLDFLLALGIVISIGKARSLEAGMTFPSPFYAVLAPAYALSIVTGIAVCRGYVRSDPQRLRPVFAGSLVGLVAIACASFFLKEIAFSRAVVLLSCPLIALVLGSMRLAQNARSRIPRRAILVGPRSEAERLRKMLANHPASTFELLGYVDRGVKRSKIPKSDTPRLGSLHQLRDLVRIRRVDDVIFAAAGLSNDAIFSLIQQLNGLPVQFKILTEGSRHIIGKASVHHLVLPALIEVNGAPTGLRTPMARRAFEISAALAGILFYPAIRILAGVLQRPGYRRLADRLLHLPAVLSGRLRLIGIHPHEAPFVPVDLGMRPGVFGVTDGLPNPQPDPDEIARTYRLYAANQSVSLDIDILQHAIRALLDEHDSNQVYKK